MYFFDRCSCEIKLSKVLSTAPCKNHAEDDSWGVSEFLQTLHVGRVC